jgi:peroxiredoxin Q/BCP
MKRTLLASLLAAFGFPVIMNAEPLAVGAPAPEVTAVDQDGKSVDLKEVYAKGPTLVYFYPKSDTPGCTAQACSLRDDWSVLQGKNIQVIAVSGDDTEAQKKFQEKYKLPFTVVADSEGKVADAFGVPRNGKIASRQSFLVKDGKIVWNMLKASTANHSKDVLKAYEEASKS